MGNCDQRDFKGDKKEGTNWASSDEGVASVRFVVSSRDTMVKQVVRKRANKICRDAQCGFQELSDRFEKFGQNQG